MDGEGMNHPGPDGYGRSASMDTTEAHMNPHGMKGPGPGHGGMPPQYPRGGYSYGHPPPYASRPTLPIKSVVTNSFEEREDGRMEHRDAGMSFGRREYDMHHGRAPAQHCSSSQREDARQAFEPPRIGGDYQREDMGGREPVGRNEREPPHYAVGRDPHHYARELPPLREGEFEGRLPPPREMMRGSSRAVRVPPSPRGEPPYIHRSHSTGAPVPTSYRGPSGPMKRSFWHHARSDDEFQSLPNEFMPPKRSKVTPPSGRGRDYVVTARASSDEMFAPERHGASIQQHMRSPGWFNRAMYWEASREADFYSRESGSKLYNGSWSARSPTYREGSTVPQWSDAPNMPSPRGYDGSPGQSWGRFYSEDAAWNSPQNRDEAESKHMGSDARDRGGSFEMRRQGTFESSSSLEPPMRFIPGPTRGMEPANMVAPRPDVMLMSDPVKRDGAVRLLALPEDRISLSETLCLVRENIEVFTATMEDVEAPAPGRKHAVVVGQVGLRCIHCRHTTRSSDRVKRAVCYPSSIKRIYRTVIDMKLDHFQHCRFVPVKFKETLNVLKANNTRSTGTTMQYFIRGAGTLGMVDGPAGVRMLDNRVSESLSMSLPGSSGRLAPETTPSASQGKISLATRDSGKSEKSAAGEIVRTNSASTEGSSASVIGADDAGLPTELFTGRVPLSIPEDKASLSPLRCFLREQVCAFSATEEDIAVRTPTTFSVSVGQVGIGCVHCLRQPAKMRLNRAVCFPFSIARIYQSVADIQRFHLGECKSVPPALKQKFIDLQSASSKGSKGLATRQYWVTSAKKLGLVDTPQGIRFGRDPSIPEAKAISLDILAQVASKVNTVNRPLVLPEDKPYIAEFLYVVMEQLQACRFTEADRNKRRLKDVGCVGVECKNCAGKVDSRKFFWSSVSAVESNFVSVHTHMMECKAVPELLKEKLSDLKKLRKEQTSALKTGSQKAFFSRVWERLHSQGKQAAVEEASKENVEQQEKAEDQQVKPATSVDEMSRESIEATPLNSPMASPKEMEISPVAKPPSSPCPAEQVNSTDATMGVVSV